MTGLLAAPKVLVVEDELAQRELLVYNLQKEGMDVISADNGEDALLLAAAEVPDLILLDWMLPLVPGIRVCAQIKAQPTTQHIPIMMVSARGDDADLERGYAHGANDYLVKPYSIRDLVAKVKKHLANTNPAFA